MLTLANPSILAQLDVEQTVPPAYDIIFTASVLLVLVLDVLAIAHLIKHRRGSSDWAWALVVVALPLLGVMLYALLGPHKSNVSTASPGIASRHSRL